VSELGEERGKRLVAGRYELDVLIGKGGFAEVWRARHLALNSFVAIKFLHGATAQRESARRRFTTEAQVTAQLKSRHAVQVFDFGVSDEGHPYIVMELLEGESLGLRIERLGRIGVVATARILAQSARALHRAHQLGIVHRDFKPDNIVISTDDDGRDHVKVLDFGIAKLVGELDIAPSAADSDAALEAATLSTFTKTGALLGTPMYMAPEQIRNAAMVDLRADIWAYGIVAFECLTGATPFGGRNLIDLFQKITSGNHPRAHERDPSIPPAFDAWFATACAPEPSARFADAHAACDALLAALDCARADVEPAVGMMPTASGETRVVVIPSPDRSDASGATIESGTSDSSRNQLAAATTERGAGASSANLAAARPSDSLAVTHTIPEDDDAPGARARGGSKAASVVDGSRRRVTIAALASVTIFGALVWLATSRTGASPAPPPPPATLAAVLSSAPLAPSIAVPRASLAPSADPITSAAPAAPSASADGKKLPAARTKPNAVATTPEPSAAPATAAAPPPPPATVDKPAATPPPPAQAPLDPGSYR
jgi:serine/threonine protein kinase